MTERVYTLSLTMQLENAAFEEDRAAETARILRRLADRIESGAGDFCPLLNNRECAEGWLLDRNGNSVGQWKAAVRRYNT